MMGTLTRFDLVRIFHRLNLAQEYMREAKAAPGTTTSIDAAYKAINEAKEMLLYAALTDVAVEPMERTDVEV